MRAVVQRVRSAEVHVNGEKVSGIEKGLLVFAGLGKDDGDADYKYMSEKIAGLRIFPDGNQDTAISVRDAGGEMLIVSQFTLYGDVRKGRRPSFSEAMPAEDARREFERFVEVIRSTGLPVQTGVFQAMMDVTLVNDGPYTILIDSKKGF